MAQTGTVVVVESEGNGRMCLTLPEVWRASNARATSSGSHRGSGRCSSRTSRYDVCSRLRLASTEATMWARLKS